MTVKARVSGVGGVRRGSGGGQEVMLVDMLVDAVSRAFSDASEGEHATRSVHCVRWHQGLTTDVA
eukprot:1808965-Pyramimonas_sp.AAC.1